jgi:hypothetical protein
MVNFSKLMNAPRAITYAVALMTLLASHASGNATVLAFDYTNNTQQTVATVTGSNGTLSFTLDLGDPTASNVEGDFAMDLVGPGNVIIGSISLDLGPLFLGPGPTDFGDIHNTVVTDFLYNFNTWQAVALAAGDLPLSIVVTSQLDTVGDPFTPILTVTADGDLTVVTATPLPGALALFSTGVGVLGLVGARRRRRLSPQVA